jgi:hypothetical protein
MNFAVVVLNKYPQLARNLIRSIRENHTRMPRVIVIADGHDEMFGENVLTRREDRSFVFARNANLGIDCAGNKDVILANDDCEITEKDSIFKLVSIAAKFPRLGILSPVIDGGVGNPLQKIGSSGWPQNAGNEICLGGTEADAMPVCFPFVFLSRAMITAIGPLDENFSGYGFDDNDLCIRARRAGWETAITRQVCVKHGSGGEQLRRGENWSISFAKDAKPRPDNLQYFLSKYPQKVTVLPAV